MYYGHLTPASKSFGNLLAISKRLSRSTVSGGKRHRVTPRSFIAYSRHLGFFNFLHFLTKDQFFLQFLKSISKQYTIIFHIKHVNCLASTQLPLSDHLHLTAAILDFQPNFHNFTNFRHFETKNQFFLQFSKFLSKAYTIIFHIRHVNCLASTQFSFYDPNGINDRDVYVKQHLWKKFGKRTLRKEMKVQVR